MPDPTFKRGFLIFNIMKKVFNERKAFNFYRSYYEVFNQLPVEERLSFITAILDRQFTGEEPTNLEGMALFAYISQKHSIDAQINGYSDKKKSLKNKGGIEPPSEGGTQGGYEGGTQGGYEGGYEAPSVQEQEQEEGKEKEQLEREIKKNNKKEKIKEKEELYDINFGKYSYLFD